MMLRMNFKKSNSREKLRIFASKTSDAFVISYLSFVSILTTHPFEGYKLRLEFCFFTQIADLELSEENEVRREVRKVVL